MTTIIIMIYWFRLWFIDLHYDYYYIIISFASVNI